MTDRVTQRCKDLEYSTSQDAVLLDGVWQHHQEISGIVIAACKA